jgi:Bacterial Ig-like domain (group 2)
VFKLRFFLIPFLAVILVSCPQLIGEFSTVSKLQGTISPWTRGERIVKTIDNSTINSQTIAQGNMNIEGVFEILLPETIENNLNSFEFPQTCSSNVTISPPTVQIKVITQLEVVTKTNKQSGVLIQVFTNRSSDGAEQLTGSNFAIYYYSDRDARVGGTCFFANSTISLNLNLKRGWNSVLAEFKSASNIQYSSQMIPEKTKWQFLPHKGDITVTIGNAPVALEVGESVQLSATATELDGTLSDDQKFTWTSSNPNLANVDSSGSVTAKDLGPITISATLTSAPATGSSVNIMMYGFTAEGSTYNIEDQSLGMAIKLRYQDETGKPPQQAIQYTLKGPAGWNSDRTLEEVYDASEIGIGGITVYRNSILALNEIPIVTGNYQIIRKKPISTTNVAQDRFSKTFIPESWTLPRSPLQYHISQSDPNAKIIRLSTGTNFFIDASKKTNVVKNFRLTDFATTSDGSSSRVLLLSLKYLT